MFHPLVFLNLQEQYSRIDVLKERFRFAPLVGKEIPNFPSCFCVVTDAGVHLSMIGKLFCAGLCELCCLAAAVCLAIWPLGGLVF